MPSAAGATCEQDKLIVKLAERKRFVTITNVTTGSGATVSVFAVLSSLAPALRSAASLRVKTRSVFPLVRRDHLWVCLSPCLL